LRSCKSYPIYFGFSVVSHIMDINRESHFYKILKEIDVYNDEEAYLPSIPRQKIPVTRRICKQIRRIQKEKEAAKHEEMEESKIDWSKYSNDAYYNPPKQSWSARTRHCRHRSNPEVLKRMSRVTAEVALRKRRRSHVDVEVTVSPAPSPRIMSMSSPDLLTDAPPGDQVISAVLSNHEFSQHRRHHSTDSFFSRSENFEYNSAYETDCEYVHNSTFLNLAEKTLNAKDEERPSMEDSVFDEDDMKLEMSEEAPIFEDRYHRDSMESPNLKNFESENALPSDSELPFSLAPDGLVDTNTLIVPPMRESPGVFPSDQGFQDDAESELSNISSLSLPSETDNGKVEELLRDLDKVDQFEKDLLKQIADLSQSMHEGYRESDLLAMEDANFRTARESRKSREVEGSGGIGQNGWESVVYSGKPRVCTSPQQAKHLLQEMEDLKITNRQLKREILQLHEELEKAHRRLGDLAPPANLIPIKPNRSLLSGSYFSSSESLSELSDVTRPSTAADSTCSHHHPVLEWLQQINCESCFDIFLANGLDEISKIFNIEDSILTAMQIPVQQQERILQRIHLIRPFQAKLIPRKCKHQKKEIFLPSKEVPPDAIPLSKIWQPVCRFVKRYTWIWHASIIIACIAINMDFFEATYDDR